MVGDDDGKKKEYFVSENTVKATKELVSSQQQHELSMGRANLENVHEEICELKKDVTGIKGKISGMEENLKTLLEIMMSRQEPVQRH